MGNIDFIKENDLVVNADEISLFLEQNQVLLILALLFKFNQYYKDDEQNRNHEFFRSFSCNSISKS